MTVESEELNYNNYTGDGVEVTYAYTFRMDDLSWLKVTVDEVLTTNVTVDTGLKTVTFTNAPANGSSILLYTDIPSTQLANYTPYGPFPAEVTEEAFDKLTLLIQQLYGTGVPSSGLFVLKSGDRLSGDLLFGDSSVAKSPNASFLGDQGVGYVDVNDDNLRIYGHTPGQPDEQAISVSLLTGITTFLHPPKVGEAPVDTDDLVDKAYVDSKISAGYLNGNSGAFSAVVGSIINYDEGGSNSDVIVDTAAGTIQIGRQGFYTITATVVTDYGKNNESIGLFVSNNGNPDILLSTALTRNGSNGTTSASFGLPLLAGDSLVLRIATSSDTGLILGANFLVQLVLETT